MVRRTCGFALNAALFHNCNFMWFLVLSWNFPWKSLQLNYNARCLPTAIKCQRQQRYQIWRKFKIKCREQRYELFIITPELYGRHRCRVLLAGEKRTSTWGKIYTLYVRLHLSDRLFFCTRAHLFFHNAAAAHVLGAAFVFLAFPQAINLIFLYGLGKQRKCCWVSLCVNK